MRSDYDIVVVGGGAAGIGAARIVHEAGATVLLVEARDRLGGRAWTVEAGGFRLDLGCGWLHSAEENAWVARVLADGFSIDKTRPPWGAPSLTDNFPLDDQHDYFAARAVFYEAVEAAAARGEEGPASTLLPPAGRWNALLDASSSYVNAAELDRVSILDLDRYRDSHLNWRVVEGYGTAIAAHGAALPQRLGCPVRSIDHRGARIVVETADGALSAAALIVAVPTAALAEGAIRFIPDLPDKREAASGLPLGVADKLYFRLDEAEAFPPDSRVYGRTDRAATGAYHVRPMGKPLLEGYFGGRLASDLEAAGEGAFAEFARQELAAIYGTDFLRRLTVLAASAWETDPYARGSYSHALPGRADERARLAAPVDGRLFFAGEATSPHFFSTAHGALESGMTAARLALAAIGRCG